MALAAIVMSACGTGTTPPARVTLPALQSAVVCPPAPTHGAVTSPPRSFAAAPKQVTSNSAGYCAYLSTDKGVIAIRLRPEYVPNTVNNFVFLAQQGFYDGLKFFEVCPDPTDPQCPSGASLLVTGDPTNSGTGGPGYTVPSEPVIGDYIFGAVAMYGGATGSEFFISKGDSRSITRQHVIFGEVTDGIPTLAALQKGDVLRWVAIEPTAPEP